MPLSKIVKVSRRTFFDPVSWIGAQTLRVHHQALWTALKNIFVPTKPVRVETFEQAMQRLNLTEDNIQTSAKRYHYIAIVFFGLGLLVFFHAFYLLFKGEWLSFFLGIAATSLFWAYSFKYDFWSLQMKRRQLGLTFSDWKKTLLNKE